MYQISLQESCKPRVIPPTEGTEVRGSVIMLHRLTACNQQYFDWAELLANSGYYVILPALPFHGLAVNSQVQIKEGALLSKDSATYEEFSNDIVRIAQNALGQIKSLSG